MSGLNQELSDKKKGTLLGSEHPRYNSSIRKKGKLTHHAPSACGRCSEATATYLSDKGGDT
jgi:hypothetical protein